MTVPRFSRRYRHGIRVLGATFVAAAALPLLGVIPLAQASSGHGVAPAAKGHGQAKVVICHATNSDTNPYVVIEVAVASVKYQGHLAHRTTPNKTWKLATTWNGTLHAAGSAKADLIEGLDGNVTKAFCQAGGTHPTPTTSTTTTPSGTTTTTPSGTTTTTSSGTTTTTPSGTTTTTSSGTTTTTSSGTTTTTPGSTVSGTKTTAPSGSSTSPGSTVLPTRFTNSPTSGSTADDDTQVLGTRVTLPRTGVSALGAVAISMLLLLTGALLLRVSAVRRRRAH
jgi:hypothetical protein